MKIEQFANESILLLNDGGVIVKIFKDTHGDIRINMHNNHGKYENDFNIDVEQWDAVDDEIHRLMDQKPKKKLRECPECCKKVKDTCLSCGMTYGRRGWRQLGVYDG